MRYDPPWLDSMYNNRALVPEHAQHFERWTRESAAARRTLEHRLDVAYGPSERDKLDIFPARQPAAPVVVFIHGGYWRSMDKRDHSFVAPAFVKAGACVVVPNYDLCPVVTIPQIVMQMARAMAWIWRHAAEHNGDPRRITVLGHSAGGHLASMMLACHWPVFDARLPAGLVTRAMSISGLHALEPLRHTPFLKDSLRLTPSDARRASPAGLPAPGQGTLYAVAGGEESAEFIRQNKLIRHTWGAGRVPVCSTLPGLHHFSIVEALATPGHRLHRLALALMRHS